MVTAPYTFFSKTLEVKVEIYIDGVFVDNTPKWDEELWIERGEDWYAFMNDKYKGKRVRVIKREEWIRASRKEENKQAGY